MKLRIRGNSIRLRLSKSEVEHLGVTGKVADAVNFGAAKPALRYELRTVVDDDRARAKFDENCLSISIPADEAGSWIGSERIGIETMQEIGENEFLHILIEKDFMCTTPRAGEDDSDAFPNPLAGGKC